MKKSPLGRFVRWCLRFFTDNPIVKPGVSLTIAVGASTTLKHALILALIAGYMCLFVSLFAVLVRLRINKNFQLMIFSIVAAIFYIPVGYLLPKYYLQVYDSIGIYLPLLAVSSIVVSDPVRISGSDNTAWAFLRSIKSAIGFGVMICLIGAIREWLAYGTVYEISMPTIAKIPGASYIYSGFIITGILIAFANVISRHVRRVKNQ